MSADGAEDKCPVDHRTREKWLEAARARGDAATTPHPQFDTTTAARKAFPQHNTRFSLDSGRWVPSRPLFNQQPPSQRPKIYRLSTDREISTIPRGGTHISISALNPAERAALPDASTGDNPPSSPAAPSLNNEHSATHDPTTGNWVYPSQEQFFNAMRRKGHDASPSDMSSIVPIHNAVNERAWKEILEWERGRGAEKCGGPRLVSFAGDSKALTPRARWNSLIGYATPFDRHDWVVERCGQNIDYVIDFYAGKGGELQGGRPLNFYLDVRPKLNSWEGIKMRMGRSLGF